MQTLKNKQDFDFVYKNGKRLYSRSFFIFVYKNQKQSLTSIGLSVSKRVGNACKRNLIKRRLRALCRVHLDKIQGLSLIFVPKAEILGLGFFEIERDFLKCLCYLSKSKKR